MPLAGEMSEKSNTKLYSEKKLSRNSVFSDESRAKGGEMRQEPLQNSFIIYNSRSISNSSNNVCDYVSRRESGLNEVRHFNYQQTTRHLLSHDILQETPIDLGYIDKIFCSKWLSDEQVIFGTKCNKLLIYDVNMQRVNAIPLLSSNSTNPHDIPIIRAGLQAIDINPSRTFLATNARNSANIAVYSLPNFEPLFVGENGHCDTIMDMCWLDDQFLVSGSKDSHLTLWRMFNGENTLATTNPLCSTECCLTGQGIRSICFNREFKEIAAISFNGFIHIFNAETFKQKLSRKLAYCSDSVSIVYHRDGFYAVGCRLYVLLLDAKTLNPIKKITTRYNGCGIRAISFQSNLLTIGTGLGMLVFYDLRAAKYLESTSGIATLKCSKGTVYSKDEMDGFQESKYAPTIYTHCYDSTGLKLFTAGGPLPSTLFGSYAGVWQ